MPSIEQRLERIEIILSELSNLSKAGFADAAPKAVAGEILSELRRRQAAHARAAKRVGPGRGSVNSSATKRRLAKNAKRFK